MSDNGDNELGARADAQMSSTDDATTAGETNRRELLLNAGMLGIAALLGTATASAQTGTAQRRFEAEMFSHENLSNFAGLTAKIWEDPELGKRYERDPRKVLAEHKIIVPNGVPTPLIPKRPQGGIENIHEAWKRNEFTAADLLIKQLSSGDMKAFNTQSTIGTQGCPLSSFSTFACWVVASPNSNGGEAVKKR
jgi:hypothetical protein